MKKTLLCAVLATAIVLGVNGAEYRHISPVSIQLIDFNLDEMRTVAGDNLDLYLGNLASLQTDLERQKQDIADAQKNLKSEKKLYDTQVSFLKSRQAIVKNAKKFFEGEEKNYEAQIKNIKKQYDMIQKMPDVSSVAMQEQLSILRSLEQDCNDRKANASKMVKDIIEQDETRIDKAYEVLSQYLIEINDKNTRLENLATQNKTALEIVKAQIKNIKDQVKAGKK
jgi:hypothetical protein